MANIFLGTVKDQELSAMIKLLQADRQPAKPQKQEDNQNNWIDMNEVLEQLPLEDKGPSRMKTGFPQLDEILGGGLAPGRLVVLGGQPGVGKSTFCLQLAENVAKSGIPVLYFSFEMQANLIAAKAISRSLFQNNSQNKITAEQLVGGNEKQQLNQEQRKLVEQVKESDEFRCAMDNFYLQTSPLPVSAIKDMVTKFVPKHQKGRENQEGQENQKDGTAKPLVIVDYLQFVPAEKGTKYSSDKEKNDEKVTQFKKLTDDGFAVILISSLNRGSYKGDMQISAFKETGEIEYTADVLLGLQFHHNYGRKTGLLKEQEKDPRDVKISVLKNRYGKSGCMVPFSYYAANDCFKEKKAAEVHEPEQPAVVEKKEKPSAKKKQIVKRCVINNTLVAEDIRKGKYEKGEPQSCEVFPEKGVNQAVEVFYTLSDTLSTLDCCVADAIYTIAIRLWADGVPQKDAVLTPRDLMKALSGDPRPTITSQKMQELYNSIKHLHAVNFEFNCADALSAQGIVGIGPNELQIYKGPFLDVSIDELTGEAGDTAQKHRNVWDVAGGNKVKISFKKNVLPLFLHSFGAALNQMITVPSNLLNVNDGKRNQSNTAENLCLKWILAQRIEIIRYKIEKNEKTGKLSTISFHGDRRLLSELQYSQKSLSKAAFEQKQRRLHDAVRQVLEYYKRIEYIADYTEMPKTDRTKLPSFKVIGPFLDPSELSY